MPPRTENSKTHLVLQETEQLTFLGVAAKIGRVELGELLLDRGASTGSEPSPLLVALRFNHPRFVDLLLRRDGQDCLSELQKKQCLRIATLEGEMDLESRKEMIKVLLQNGIDVDATINNCFNRALHLAVQNDKRDVIQALVDLGADVNAQNRNGMTPLILACRNSNVNVARIFIRSGRAKVSRGTDTGSHPLLGAIENKHGELVRELLISGANANLPRNDRVSPLELAVAKSDEAIVKMLLTAGADVQYSVKRLLIAAIMNYNQDIVRSLLRAGVDVSGQDTDGTRFLRPLSVALD